MLICKKELVMLKIILIMGIMLLMTVLNGDLPLMDLQAVCKVTLKSGEVIDGYIIAADRGSGSIYCSHGFYWATTDDAEAVLFNMEFTSIEPAKSKFENFRTDQRKRGIRFNYLKDVTSVDHYHEIEVTEKKKLRDSLIVITLEKNIYRDYELLKEIPVFLELPESLRLESQYDSPVKRIDIPVKSIQRFELIREPSEEILAKIALYRAAIYETAKGGEGDGPMLPSWFHDIVKDEENSRLFKRWLEEGYHSETYQDPYFRD
jgi:hypothetical protein